MTPAASAAPCAPRAQTTASPAGGDAFKKFKERLDVLKDYLADGTLTEPQFRTEVIKAEKAYGIGE